MERADALDADVFDLKTNTYFARNGQGFDTPYPQDISIDAKTVKQLLKQCRGTAISIGV